MVSESQNCTRRKFKIFSILLFVAAIFLPSAALTAPNLTVDGSDVIQTINGLGTNINVNSWNNGELAPALDYLIDVNGGSLFRVIRDPMNWVSSESLISGLHNLDTATLQQVYEAPKMQDLWNTIGYLNQKGVKGNQILLNFMGWTPQWIGGSGAYGIASYITSGKEGEFATMVASLIYYGRKVKNLDFTLVSPMNEEDLNCLEGPCVGASQYALVLSDLASELDYMGLNDVRFVAPDTSSPEYNYVGAMYSLSTVWGRLDHIAFHAYSSSPSVGPSYPPRNYWLTETAQWCSNCDYNGAPSEGEWSFAKETTDLILNDLNIGWAGVLTWEGCDSFWYHHNSYSSWGLLAYDQTTGIYTPRKRFYANAQINHFIRPGSLVIAENDSISSLGATIAAYNPISGVVTIVGRNTGSSSVTINGQLANIPVQVSSFAVYQTNSSMDFVNVSEIPVTSGTFSVTIPADTIFTLTSAPAEPDTEAPSVPTNLTATAVSSSQINLSWTASTDNVGVTGYRVYRGGVQIGTTTTTSYADVGLQPSTTYSYAVAASDAAGNVSGLSQTVTVTTQTPDTIPPTVSLTVPTNGTTVSGTVTVSANASDNVGVVGVQFLLDGTNLGSEKTSAPYSISWDTTAVANGTHTLSAVARDAAGNKGSSPTVGVTVSNQPSPIKLIQKASSITTSASTLTATFPSNVTAGNLVVVAVSSWPSQPSSITDNLGNTYGLAGPIVSAGGSTYSAIFSAKNVKGGKITISYKVKSGRTQMSMIIAEFFGLNKTAPVDAAVGRSGSGATPSSGNMTPTQVGDLIIGAGTHNGNGVTAAGSGFTMIGVTTEDSVNHQPLAMEYGILNTGQPVSATFSLSPSFSWSQNGALFKK